MADESKKTIFRKAVVQAVEEEKKKYLVGNTPPYLGKPFELAKASYSIGREEGRELVLASDMISRLHATITREGDVFFIEDNSSSNGTFLNNAQIESAKKIKLNHKDILKFDTFEFIFVDSARSDLWETLKPLSRTGAQIIGLYSPKGGTGLTSTAVNLAHALSTAGKKVVIADFNFAFGDVLTYSNGKVGLSSCELMREPEITGDMIDKFLRPGQGYSYIAAPSKTEEAELVNDWAMKKPELVQKLLWSLESKHDFVIVDLKNQIDDVVLTVWEASNLILLFGKPEIGHMLALKKILAIMDKLKYPESKVKLLISRLEREGGLTGDEIKGFLKRDFLSLPDAPKEAIMTTQGGKLYVMENPGSPLSNGISNLARNIRGEEIVAAVEGGIFGKLRSMLGF
ncbi:MAG: FHA domain-containing protein [Candidatus Riflebacteria bacterium]|nr:FHA domain-containing protein [Candidatus Riflebacteria bacterium]